MIFIWICDQFNSFLLKLNEKQKKINKNQISDESEIICVNHFFFFYIAWVSATNVV